MFVRMVDVMGAVRLPPDESGGYRMLDVMARCAWGPDESGGYRMVDVMGGTSWLLIIPADKARFWI